MASEIDSVRNTKLRAQIATLEAERDRLRAYVGRELDACRDNVRVTGRVHCSSTAHAFHRGTEKALRKVYNEMHVTPAIQGSGS